MQVTTLSLCLLAGLQAAGLGQAPPQGSAEVPQFAAPQRLAAGDGFLGEGRLYPSPVLRDMNGDGVGDIVLGDLFGKVTVAPGRQGETLTFGADEPLLAADGQPLKFHNW